MKFLGTDYVIVLDASFDLYQASEPNDEAAQEAFAEEYKRAAVEIAEEHGIDIKVISGTYNGPAMQRQSKNSDEGEVWQMIHDACPRRFQHAETDVHFD